MPKQAVSFELLSTQLSDTVDGLIEAVFLMKSSSLLLAALATTAKASSFVLGDFLFLNPVTSHLHVHPRVWVNLGDGVTPDTNILAIGQVTNNTGDGLLCVGQDCPLGFTYGKCTGWLKSADGESALIHAIGPGFDVEDLQCLKDDGYTAGAIFTSGRLKSFYRCDLGSEPRCT
ncbi:hypothetical protein CDV31_005309 [Fusarium ambrosium]|uniref:Uncharacterized protein n=1 Tax=Fusarium ambrosium TaxID=131363 RepID=A0A428UK96_9HYPO|nr:hypothetical protein CDV31_005309 [Fusarium ambrosium]